MVLFNNLPALFQYKIKTVALLTGCEMEQKEGKKDNWYLGGGSAGVARRQALRCARVSGEKLMSSGCNWCEYFIAAEEEEELRAKGTFCVFYSAARRQNFSKVRTVSVKLTDCREAVLVIRCRCRLLLMFSRNNVQVRK